MDSGKSLDKSLVNSDYSYSRVHAFFWVSELLVSFAFSGVKVSAGWYYFELDYVGRMIAVLQPSAGLLVAYIADSFAGKFFILHVTSCCIVLSSVVLLVAYSLNEFSPTLGACFIAFVVLGKGWHPLRYAIVYSQLTPPINKIRRFVVIHVAAHALGEGFVYLLEMAHLNRQSQTLWLVTQLIITVAVFHITVVILYKYRYLHMDFQYFATEKCLMSIHRAINEQKKTSQLKMPEEDRKRAMGLLFVFCVLALSTMIYFDSYVIKLYLIDYRNFIPNSELSQGFPIYFMFYVAGVVLVFVIEFIFIPLFARWRIYISYITMITLTFIVTIAALVTLGILSVKMGYAAPFPPPFEGEAHVTLFNCLSVMSELEWPDGHIDRIDAFSYHRILNVPVVGGRTMDLRDMAIFNPAFGLYQLANMTIEANKENLFIIQNDGIKRLKLPSNLIHTRAIKTTGHVRVLDCLEKCCHGQLLFMLNNKLYMTYNLTDSYISDMMDMNKGVYELFYSPDGKQTLLLGEVRILKTSKLVLVIHSLKKPKVNAIEFITMGFKQSSFYYPLLVLRTVIHALLEPYLNLLIVLKTQSVVFTVMFGLLLFVVDSVDFISDLVYPAFSSFYLFYVTVIVLTGLCLFVFLLMVVKMIRYAYSDLPLTLRPNSVEQKPTVPIREKKKASVTSGYSEASDALSSSSAKFKTV